MAIGRSRLLTPQVGFLTVEGEEEDGCRSHKGAERFGDAVKDGIVAIGEEDE